jgi:hypothetical protein
MVCGFEASQHSLIHHSFYLLWYTLKHSPIQSPTSHSLHFSCILFCIPHAEEVQQFTLEEWIGQWLLKFTLSQRTFFSTTAGLPTGWWGWDKLPAFSVEGKLEISVCRFGTALCQEEEAVRNCHVWQVKRYFFFFGGGGGSAFMSPVWLINCESFCDLFQCILYASYSPVQSVASECFHAHHKLPSVAGGLCIFDNTFISYLSLQTIVVKSSLVLERILAHFSHFFDSSRSCGIPFLLGHTVPQQLIIFLVRSSNKSGEGKELSTYSLYPCHICGCSCPVLS